MVSHAIASVPAHNHLLTCREEESNDYKYTISKETGKLWTWMVMTGGKHQLDYILVRRKWHNSIKNCEAYSTFANVGPDHGIVTLRSSCCSCGLVDPCVLFQCHFPTDKYSCATASLESLLPCLGAHIFTSQATFSSS